MAKSCITNREIYRYHHKRNQKNPKKEPLRDMQSLHSWLSEQRGSRGGVDGVRFDGDASRLLAFSCGHVDFFINAHVVCY